MYYILLVQYPFVGVAGGVFSLRGAVVCACPGAAHTDRGGHADGSDGEELPPPQHYQLPHAANTRDIARTSEPNTRTITKPTP